MNAKIHESLKTELLNSLRAFGNNPRYAIIDQSHDDTLQWVWLKKERGGPGLLEWFGSDEGLFWISGKPGAGKSTLCKFIECHDNTMDLLQSNSPGRTLLMSFYFWDLGQPSERTFSGLLHNLLSQILNQIPELVLAVLGHFQKLKQHTSRYSTRSSIWSETELQTAFKNIFQAKVPETTVLCIIDGLDECEERGLQQMLQFLSKLATPTKSSSLKFKILCSGRPANFIELNFAKYPYLRLQNHTSQDIEDFIHARIQTVTDYLPPDARRSRIIAEIVPEVANKTEGVFMWARVVAEDLVALIAAGREEELYEKIKELPPELEQLYISIISKIPPQSRHQTYNYLQSQIYGYGGSEGPDNLLAMTLASYPLNEIRRPPSDADRWSAEQKITQCHRIKRILQDSCRGLINLPHYNPSWTEDEKINLFCRGEIHVHKTVKDYLFGFSAREPNPNEKVWSGIEKNRLLPFDLQRTSFFFHLLKVDSTTLKQAVPRVVWNPSDFECHSISTFRGFMISVATGEVGKLGFSITWLPAVEEIFRTKCSSPSEIVDFYDAFCVDSYVEFERCTGDPAIEAWNTDMLCVAVKCGLFPYLKAKLKRNVHLRSGRPLLHYYFRGFDGIVSIESFAPLAKLLHSHGFRFDHIFNGRTTWEYILIWVRRCNNNEWWDSQSLDKILILCLELGADPNQKVISPTYRCSALHVALLKHKLSCQRQKALIKAFLLFGAATNAKDSNGCTAIQMAEQNWPSVVALLKSGTSRPLRKRPVVSKTHGMIPKKTESKFLPIVTSLLVRIKRLEDYKRTGF